MNGATAYWCHSCRTEVHPLPGQFTCPLCAGEFIEELTVENADQQQRDAQYPVDPFHQYNQDPPNFANLFTLLQQLMPQPQAHNPHHNMYFTNNGDNFVFHANIGPLPNAAPPFGNNPFLGYANFRQRFLHLNVPYSLCSSMRRRLLQQVLGGQPIGGGVFGDYVVGDNLEPLLNQLFNQHQSYAPRHFRT